MARPVRNVLATLLVACLMLASAVACSAGQKKSQPEKSAAKDTAMRVVLVRSSETGCEPNCPEWIAARGEITLATQAEFKTAYKRARVKSVPVVIDSVGGSVEAAIAIGKLIRKNQSPVIVGMSLLTPCVPTDEACGSGKKSAYVRASHIIIPGYCLSACGLVLAGGTERMTMTNTIGTHQITRNPSFERIRVRETYRIVNGRKKVVSKKVVGRKTVILPVTTKLSKAYRKMIAQYFAAMNVNPEYFDYFERAKPESIYFLTDAELVATRIITMRLDSTVLFGKDKCAGSTEAPYCVTR
jgi:hypothetical protein